MPYDAFVCDGTQIKIKQPADTGTFQLINGVQTAGFSGSQKPQIEYTALSDTAAKFKTGRMDFGSFNFTIAFDPSDSIHQYLLTRASTAGTDDDFEITLTDAGAAVLTFNAGIGTFDLSLEKQQVGLVGISAKLNGAMTLTP